MNCEKEDVGYNIFPECPLISIKFLYTIIKLNCEYVIFGSNNIVIIVGIELVIIKSMGSW